ncbi:MAG: hypothetical protein A2365_03345 [Candidatus Nealsonbacteria bacterium RIFOXYB1_FULL_40_15]|uniref:PilN domain-containing protein n=2 Tax=Candidatus Nealsoniibacteriota TaxID=1817911 RepID=A0A1G2ETV9_9BACT|nr:MAG: hypothetical protein A2365_03345 [Candidatus Nealsonbacteria bacterium RIFOXYB1_FULL_40_15]OGZ28821.1 MAG: hypothetical protein A2427_00160 [Candidatus Nealsonbacteria bacterium RIFOXYC1_FULL_40_7]OGZ29377.1 MAG: hypothetical protein A2562_04695 [Candidatus Nealsonbacteria bacterium RIFOXYD1_FULL_39_11]
MAISLTKKRTAPAPGWAIAVLVVFVIIILALLGSYIYFSVKNSRVDEKVSQLESEAFSYENKIKEKEGEVSLVQQRIEDFKKLMSGHRELANIFEFLEAKTMPSIRFRSFDFNEIKEKEAIVMDGTGPSFIAVGQQIDIFKKDPAVSRISLLSISITDEGEVNFSVDIGFRPDFFFPQTNGSI